MPDVTKNLEWQFIQDLAAAKNLEDLYQLKVQYVGKKGLLRNILKSLGTIDDQKVRSDLGQKANDLDIFINSELEQKKLFLENQVLEEKLANEKIDVSLPGPNPYKTLNKRHLVPRTIDEMKRILVSLGFEEAIGPEIEDEWHNFTALNIPETHPARDMHDTFYVDVPGKKGDSKALLRTHTSTVQIRYLEQYKPKHNEEVKFFSIGKTYRADHDATHTPMFHQVECFYLGANITLSHMKAYAIKFFEMYFGVSDLPLRFRPSYFPFTEPSFEVDIMRSQDKWLELGGCGMVHSNVLKNTSPLLKDFQGFAFGFGVERLAMMKRGIPDVRYFFENDIRWLNHYN